MKTYQDENNELLEGVLSNFYNYWRRENHIDENNAFDKNFPMLEFFVTPVCNQACEYCYVIKHGNELYPKDIRNKDTILKNLDIYLNFCLENNFTIPRLDLFSGEIWGMEFGTQVLSMILDYMKKGLIIKSMMIPSNCSFIVEEKSKAAMQYFLDRFEEFHCRFIISASIDGKFVEETARPFKGAGNTARLKDDDYYKNIFEFCFRNNLGFHPMIAASDVDKWIENYDWWHEQIKKYADNYDGKEWFNRIMFLEVRNDEWGDEAIINYLKFLKHAIDKDYNTFWKDDPIKFFHLVLCGSKLIKYNGKHSVHREDVLNTHYSIYSVNTSGPQLGCSVPHSLCVRLGDLTIMPCHRTGYDKFNYGKYNVEDGKITGVTANNPYLANRIFTQTQKGSFKCDSCPNHFCIKGCYGAQFESTGDLFYPCKSVCELFTAKFLFLILFRQKFLNDHPEVQRDTEVSNEFYASSFNKLLTMEEGKKWIEIIKEKSLLN